MNCRLQLSAEFGRHDSLDIFEDAGNNASVVVELLRAARRLDSRLLAFELVVRTLINVLEAPPSADIIDQHVTEVGMAGPDLLNQLRQTHPVLDLQPALAFVPISVDDRKAVHWRICANCRRST